MRKWVYLLLASICLPVMAGCGSSTEKQENKTIHSRTIDEIKVEEYVDAKQVKMKEEKITCNVDLYKMSLVLDDDNHTLSGNINMTITNQTEDILDKLCLRNYSATILKEFGEGESRISNVTVADTNMELPIIEREDPSVVYLDMGEKPLYPGKTINVSLNYFTDIPKQEDRFGFTKDEKGSTYQLSFCFPTLAMYENGKWSESPYVENAESNYNKVTSYYVELHVPDEYTVVGSGKETKKGDITIISGENLREMAIVVSDKYNVKEKTVDGVTINQYSLNYENAETYNEIALKAAEDSVALYSKLFGKYPYEELDVVQVFMPNAMEYPGLVMIGMPDIENYNNLNKDGQYVNMCRHITHEIAHQWFYGAIGADPYREAWLDEGFAEFCEDVIYQQCRLESIVTAVELDEKKHPGSDVYGRMSDEEFAKDMKQMIETSNKKRINLPLNEYNMEEMQYSECVYKGGTEFLFELEQEMGEATFFSMMQQYYKAYCFKETTTEEFLEIVKLYNNTEEVNDIINKYIDCRYIKQ